MIPHRFADRTGTQGLRKMIKAVSMMCAYDSIALKDHEIICLSFLLNAVHHHGRKNRILSTTMDEGSMESFMREGSSWIFNTICFDVRAFIETSRSPKECHCRTARVTEYLSA